MVRTIAVFLCGALTACSQNGAAQRTPQVAAKQAPTTTARHTPVATEAMTPEEQQYAALSARCEAAMQKQQQKANTTAMLGGALSMVGGIAGIGGEGAAIVGQAASVGGSLVQAGAGNSARTAIEKECMP